MSYYDTIDDDVRRAKEILARGTATAECDCWARDEGSPHRYDCPTLQPPTDGGAIYGGDSYAAYKLLESFVTEIEHLQLLTRYAVEQKAEIERLRELVDAVGEPVCQLALRHERLRAAPDCTCRNHVCGHRASRHQGEGGACVEPGCGCGPGGWQ